MAAIPIRESALLSGVGHVPLVEIHAVREQAPGCRVFATLEAVNPGGSIKDRPVVRMLMKALQTGRLDAGRRLLDSSSGNAGISYALYGAALGVPVTLVVPGNASRERLDRIRASGAELILTDPLEGYDFAVAEARRLARDHPERYWYCDQYSNPENWRAHYDTTGPELLRGVMASTGRPPDAFVAGIGTGGTLTGVARRLKEAHPATVVIAAIPDEFPGIEGLKPLGHPGDMVPAILDESLIDRRLPVCMEDAIPMCRKLAKTGLFVGPSAGALVHVACRVALEDRLRCIATLLPDTGERYVSTGLWAGTDVQQETGRTGSH
ncbi:PLP-dependent cysteine synthase family protein [Aromatoleum petrolei]|uniref:Pyridoxal-phosphate dependent enzyme n=1 Tax=Aromatoleum petrolei TaxID=76116 RepID=A0ABX1MJN2_9RHOO|nr:cysteine synthase family protein [Aromatoleum petrolei]NMF88162.1 pyridoxal-phosphate dependent enzyme [Aromatoleum petrolei]QTQ38978.1 Cysteine synthase [Aromatoleum petrolei]